MDASTQKRIICSEPAKFLEGRARVDGQGFTGIYMTNWQIIGESLKLGEAKERTL